VGDSFYSNTVNCVTKKGELVVDNGLNDQCFEKISCHLLFVSKNPAEITAGSTWHLADAYRAWGGDFIMGHHSSAELETDQRNVYPYPPEAHLDTINCARSSGFKISDKDLKKMLSYIIEIQN
jgi:hypothetical protein